MSGSSFGPNTKGGTVYSGPSPVGTTGTVYGGPPAPAGGTVYGGAPAGGTVYNGPAAGGAVYGGAPAGARPGYGGNVGAVNVGAKKGARIFFYIAGVTALRTLLIFLGVQHLNAVIDPNKLQQLLIIDLVIAGIFALIGVFTHNGSKVALVIGMVLYGIDTLLMLLNPVPNAIYIIIHGLFLYYLFNAYRQFAD